MRMPISRISLVKGGQVTKGILFPLDSGAATQPLQSLAV